MATNAGRGRLYTTFAVLLAAAVCGMVLVSPAFAASAEGCSIFSITPGCDLSGWMKLVLGDILIAASLAIFLHHLSRRSNKKIEKNSAEIKKINVSIQRILTDQKNVEMRRKIFVAPVVQEPVCRAPPVPWRH